MNGQVHRTRAFNLETAEQFNSWLDRYKSLLEQMSATSHDFVVHSLFLLFAEIVDQRNEQRAAHNRRQNNEQDSGSEAGSECMLSHSR